MKEENNSKFKPIVVKDVFMAKNPGLAKLIPGFIYRWINQIIQIDFINDFLSRNGHLMGIDFINVVFKEFNIREHIQGFHQVPDNGRFIFASNHPLGGFDGMMLGKIVSQKLGDVKFLSNDILMSIPQMKPLFVPVNKHGGHSRDVAKFLTETYNSDSQVIIFPAGLASRKIKGKITDLEWKKHFITKAIQHKRDVVPVFFGERNSNRFYIVAKLRKFFRIKWNLEMFLLPGETVKRQNSDIHVWFGKPIPYTTFNNTKSHKDWTEYVREVVYKLPLGSNNYNL